MFVSLATVCEMPDVCAPALFLYKLCHPRTVPIKSKISVFLNSIFLCMDLDLAFSEPLVVHVLQ